MNPSVFLFDAVSPNRIPASAAVVAYYEDGTYANYAMAKAAHPTALLVPIDVRGIPGSMIYDAEPGAIWPMESAVALAIGNLNDGKWATIYCSLSNLTALKNELTIKGYHISTSSAFDPKGVFWWAAGYTNTPYIAPSSVATQFEGGMTAPFDITDCMSFWPYVMFGKPPPPSPTPQPTSSGNAMIIGFARTPSGKGGWYADDTGAVFQKGDAPLLGGDNPGAQGAPAHLNAPIVGIASHPTASGFWLVGADGGVFNHGVCKFFGSMANQHLNQPIVQIVSTPSGNGYWLIAKDGGMFNFGDADFVGASGAQ